MEINSGKQKRTIVPLGPKEYLIEGHAIYLKWSMREGPPKVEFHYGPSLEVGKDFQGLGVIQSIEQSETNDPTTKAIRFKVK